MTQGGAPPVVSIILPVRNQAAHVEAIAGAYLVEMARLGTSHELIFVVNGSTDGSRDKCVALGRKHPSIKVVDSEPGWGRAVKRGLENATGDLLCYTNSARTTPGTLGLAIRYALVNERVIVKASRKSRDSLVRRLGSVLYNFEARMLFGLAVWDINGTPKVFHRSFVPLLDLREDGDLIDLEFVVACNELQLPLLEMPTYATRRWGGKSTTNLRSALVMYVGALRLYAGLRLRSTPARTTVRPEPARHE